MNNIANGGIAPQHERFSRLPAEVRARPQWCITPGTASDKAPRTIDGRHASVADPTTWSDFETARREAVNRGWLLGLILTADDEFAVIDLDVKDATTHPAQPELWTTQEDFDRYWSMVQQFDSYTEVSRGGKGFHIIVRSNIGKGRRRDGVEVYSQERFIICTGNVYVDRPVADRQAMLDNMVSQMPKTDVTARALEGEREVDWSLATRAVEDTGEMGRLFRGDWKGRYESQSHADLALIKLLLPHAESPGECWETFRVSWLGRRPKAARPDYAQSTVGLAMQHLENNAGKVQHGKALAEAMGLVGEQVRQRDFFRLVPTHNAANFRLLRDDDLDQLPALRWLVKGIIPDAGIGAIYGDSGTYKSFLALDLLAHISNGQEWFGRKVKPAPAVYVPFEGQGGIPNRIKAWRLAQARVRYPDALMIAAPPEDVLSHVAVIVEAMNLQEPADREKLVVTLIENGWAGGVLCIDTLAHASSGIDENSSEMGKMISILSDLQHRLGGVVLVIHHSGKDPGRGMRGWSGLHAAMDFVVECQRDKTGARFVLTKVKDDGDGLSFVFTMQTIPVGVDEDGESITSLAVCPTPGQGAEHPSRAGGKPAQIGIRAIDAETSSADDRFIHQWVNKEVRVGKFPSKNSLKGQLPAMKETYQITQDRVAAAIERLLASEMLVMEKENKSPNGNVWIRPLDPPQAAG